MPQTLMRAKQVGKSVSEMCLRCYSRLFHCLLCPIPCTDSQLCGAGTASLLYWCHGAWFPTASSSSYCNRDPAGPGKSWYIVNQVTFLWEYVWVKSRRGHRHVMWWIRVSVFPLWLMFLARPACQAWCLLEHARRDLIHCQRKGWSIKGNEPVRQLDELLKCPTTSGWSRVLDEVMSRLGSSCSVPPVINSRLLLWDIWSVLQFLP